MLSDRGSLLLTVHLQLIESAHCVSLDIVSNVDVGFHGLIVAVSRPFHDHLCRDTEC